jgi:hypothetical protein
MRISFQNKLSAGGKFPAVAGSFFFLPVRQIYNANRHYHPEQHTDNNDEAESQLKRSPQDYFNGYRVPVLVQKNDHQEQRYRHYKVA